MMIKEKTIKPKRKNEYEYFELYTTTPDKENDLEFEVKIKVYAYYDDLYDDYDYEYDFDYDTISILNMKHLKEYNEEELINYIIDIIEGEYKKELESLEEQIYEEWCERNDEFDSIFER